MSRTLLHLPPIPTIFSYQYKFILFLNFDCYWDFTSPSSPLPTFLYGNVLRDHSSSMLLSVTGWSKLQTTFNSP